MTYDKWGNVTEIKVKGSSGTSTANPTSWYTGITLGRYTYSGENGVLEKMEYGNGSYITYEYDIYGRQTWVKHWDANDVLTHQEHYFYNGNGNLSRMEYLDGTGVLLQAYIYEYDSLGRLIRSQLEDGSQLAMQTEHIYDASNRLSGQNYYIGGVDFSEEFVYNEADGTLSRMTTANGDSLSYQYDDLKRLEEVTAKSGNTTLYTKGYVYAPYGNDNLRTTGQIAQVSYDIGSGIDFDYTYDELGNIATENGVSYTYDDLGQLTSVTKDGVTTTFVYDTAGNIREVKQGNNTLSSYTYGNNNWKDLLTAFNNEKIAYEGQTFNTTTGTVTGTPTSGNPISYFNGTRWNFTWQKGRQMATASSEDKEISYVYDLNGLRTEKTVVYVDNSEQGHTHEYTTSVTEPTCTTAGYTTYTCDCGESYVDNLVDALGHNYVLIEQNVSDGKIYRCTRCGATYTEGSIGINPPIDPDPPVDSRARNGNTALVTEHHQYIYASGKLLRETITTTANGNTTTQILDFTYDSSGYPYALTYTNGTATPVTYYYITNLQGDVLYLVDEDGTAVATYTYDAWGKVLTAVGNMAAINPLRYRGYYYDADTHFYYLQSRFYDPEIRRFVNADGYASTGQGFLGQNMFVYCRNCPVLRLDTDGFEDEEATTKEYTGRRTTYATLEEAAAAFAAYYYYATETYGIEVFAYIVEVAVDGEIRYIYNYIAFGEPEYERQQNGKVLKKYSVKPGFYYYNLDDGFCNGFLIVGEVHTHPNSEYFSPPDMFWINAALEAASKNGAEYTAYLVTHKNLDAPEYVVVQYNGSATGDFVCNFVMSKTNWELSDFFPAARGNSNRCNYII